MARGIEVEDQIYEVDEIEADGTITVNARMLLSMDKYNIGTGVKNVKKSTNTGVPLIKAHVTMSLNEKEWGVHPRHIVGELVLTPTQAVCYGNKLKRVVAIPILTLAQFASLRVFNKQGAATQANTLISVNHSRDGSTKVDYKIIRLVPQILI